MASPSTLRVLMIGDAIGKAGRSAIEQLVPQLRTELKLDVVIVNVENLAHGRGITPEGIAEIQTAGVDYCTSGNHIFDNERGVEYLKQDNGIVLRPANFPVAENYPGNGFAELTITKGSTEHKILLINLIGQVFMKQEADNPFHVLDEILSTRPLKNYSAILIDVHAEVTSEKQGLAQYADGRISALVGTHTHVPTADLRILRNGTGLVCDLGFVGAKDSILGFSNEDVLDRFLNDTHTSLRPVESGQVLFNSVMIEIDTTTGLPIQLERIDRELLV